MAEVLAPVPDRLLRSQYRAAAEATALTGKAMKQYTDQQMRDAAAVHQASTSNPVDVFYAVCLDILGYTPLGQLMPGGTEEFDEFHRRYREVVGPI